MRHAGFWLRVVAYVIDAFMLAAVNGMALGLAEGLLGANLQSSPFPPLEVIVLGYTYFLQLSFGSILTTAIAVAYFAGMESSTAQGTLGKLALRIKVVDMEGGRIGAGTALLRYVMKIVGSVLLLVGLLMVAFTNKKQGLHDMVAKTLVVHRDSPPLPRI